MKKMIKEASAKTRLSQADVMRGALRIGVPEFVRRLDTTSAHSRLFNLEPWDLDELARAYKKKNVDRDYPIKAMTRAQAFPKD